jgi:ligand-binding SRPBCC domain-containing protein
MPVIHLETFIDAPAERVFDLARSIEAHQAGTASTGERAVAGVMSGLLGPDQQVTWRARHFGVTQCLTGKITEFDRPRHFRDVMLKGAFRHLRHDHRFASRGTGTLMIDDFDFAAPFGPFGRVAEALFLTRYMRRFLLGRNAALKRIAESGEWRRYLPGA